jgi:hypothetical protein
MARRREIKEPVTMVSAQVGHDDYNVVVESLKGKPMSEFIREHLKSVADEERKKRQLRQQTTNLIKNSAIGSLPFNTNIIENEKDEEVSVILETIQNTTKYVRREKNLDNLERILPDARAFYILLQTRVREGRNLRNALHVKGNSNSNSRLRELDAVISPEGKRKARLQILQKTRSQNFEFVEEEETNTETETEIETKTEEEIEEQPVEDEEVIK